MKPKGEFELIELIKRLSRARSMQTTLGIGDDAAVMRFSPRMQPLFCSDCMVEGVHFDMSQISPADLGYKAVSSALSDIAAMGGSPVGVVITLALPKSYANETFISGFYQGVDDLRTSLNGATPRHAMDFDVVGGDLSRSPGPIFVDVACLGQVATPILRSGAVPGDVLAVSGHLGSSAAAFHLKEQSGENWRAHHRPIPRFDLSTQLHADTCHALIDISDGLASESSHLAYASAVSIEIDELKIPIRETVRALANEADLSSLEWALYGGEDYELLAAFAPGATLPKDFTVIGRVATGAPSVTLVKPDGERLSLIKLGFDHFL